MTVALTEKRNLDTIDIDLMDSLEIAKAINNEDKKVALAVEKVLPNIAKGIDLIVNAFSKGGRLIYFGAGTSGRLGVLDASECFPTFGVPHEMVQGFIAGGDSALRLPSEGAEDSSILGLEDFKKANITEKDIVVGISASGNPPYVLTILEEAQKKGTKTIGITSNPKANISKFSDVFICVLVGEEVIAGSSRMKSGTAQKMVMNMLTTSSMIRIGKTYENYMIDVKASNDKLYDRACRIISEISKVSYKEAEKALLTSKKNVKIACVIAYKKCSKEKAETLLSQANGILRKIIC